MEPKKQYKYFAFRTGTVIVIRKTLAHLRKVKSILHNANTGFNMVQISVVGGRVVGTIAYLELTKRTSLRLGDLQCLQIDRELVKALKPFLVPGE
jgi:hypothetical protein